jgi:hypothetical protein
VKLQAPLLLEQRRVKVEDPAPAGVENHEGCHSGCVEQSPRAGGESVLVQGPLRVVLGEAGLLYELVGQGS